MNYVDVIVVGAGLSGIGAGFHLQDKSPDRSYLILEGRADIGGTWDLFRYPGIRSDSDMFTLGYSFEPWTEAKAIADGPNILNYVRRTARKYGIDNHIKFNTHVKSAAWSTETARWTVTAVTDGNEVQYSCNFLFMCSGYYNYAKGHTPEFAGVSDFSGQIIHPQFWPDNLDYAGKNVVVIGSGATAVTIVPEMARTAAHVTMVQRSPTYVVSRPSVDGAANWLRAKFPTKIAYALARWKNVLLGTYFFNAARKYPLKAKERVLGLLAQHLPEDVIKQHFTPRYNVWDQRVCLVPDADLFNAIKDGRASVETDIIDHLDRAGLALASGKHLEADVIVMATGLELQLLSDVAFTVDGEARDLSQTFNYKGMMYSDMPNLASSFGYTNASWTLKADLTCGYVTRLLNTMRKRGLRQVTPRISGNMEAKPFLEFTSGYVTRAMARFPKQGTKQPWQVHQNYIRDIMMLRLGSVDDEMEFSNPVRGSKAATSERARVTA